MNRRESRLTVRMTNWNSMKARTIAIQPRTISQRADSKFDLLSWGLMRRSFHIAIALMAILLLARPFDCFASGKFDRKAADCCTKGKCHQSADSDPCCKASLPDGNHFVSGKAADHSSPLLAVISAQVPSLAPPQPLEAPSIAVNHPPPLGRTTTNLPLLI